LLNLITRLNFISLLLLYFVYFLEINLDSYRGLNFIRGLDGKVDRFFVETSALFLVSDFGMFRIRMLKYLFWILTFVYFVFIAKITLLAILFGLFYAWRVLRKRSILTSFIFFVGLIYALFSGSYKLLLREDLVLSMLFKYEQLRSIVASYNADNILFGEGFGFYLSDFATDPTQPYQIEMQLPMLILQIGLINVSFLLLGFYKLFQSFLNDRAFLGVLLFWVVGFVNPWLFLPVWYIAISFYSYRFFYD